MHFSLTYISYLFEKAQWIVLKCGVTRVEEPNSTGSKLGGRGRRGQGCAGLSGSQCNKGWAEDVERNELGQTTEDGLTIEATKDSSIFIFARLTQACTEYLQNDNMERGISFTQGTEREAIIME